MRVVPQFLAAFATVIAAGFLLLLCTGCANKSKESPRNFICSTPIGGFSTADLPESVSVEFHNRFLLVKTVGSTLVVPATMCIEVKSN